MKMQEFSFIANITGLIVIQLIDKVNKIRTDASVISEVDVWAIDNSNTIERKFNNLHWNNQTCRTFEPWNLCPQFTETRTMTGQ